MLFKKNLEQIFWLNVVAALLLSSCGYKSASSDVAKEKNEKQEANLPTVPIVKVQSLRLEGKLALPGQLLAYQNVPIHAKVEGYIKWIGVDRGSIVKQGQKMITIFCPELNEKAKEGAAKLAAAESSYRRAQANEDSVKSRLVEAEARLDADSLTLARLQQAAKTPGAIAQNEVDIQFKTAESDRARVASIQQEVVAATNLVIAEKHNVKAAREVLNALTDMTAYLTVEAPFNGIITERNVHVGSIVAVDAARDALPLVRIQEEDVLRLVVAVPEAAVSGTKIGQQFEFSVPAFIGRKFTGIVARPAYALNDSTRTMPVELNVFNQDDTLKPGMFANVFWVVTRTSNTLFVPITAVDADLKGTFVIRIKDNTAERITVQRGMGMKNLMEVSGDLHEGDFVALNATDELSTGTKVNTKLADQADIENAGKHSSAGGE
jgi:membrane fusion protein, multidrug efflux system